VRPLGALTYRVACDPGTSVITLWNPIRCSGGWMCYSGGRRYAAGRRDRISYPCCRMVAAA
jgi:hypothetical protein